MEPLVVIIQGRQFKLKNLNNLVASIFGERIILIYHKTKG